MSSPSDTDSSIGGNLSTRLGVESAWAGLKSYPPDLAALSLVAVAIALATLVTPSGSLPRFVLALPLLFFVPGYAAVSVLFPAVGDLSVGSTNETAVRCALAFGLSIALLALAVIALGWIESLGFLALLETLTVLTVLVAQVAVARRLRVPQHRRYRTRVRSTVRRTVDGFLHRRTRVGMITAVLVVVGMLVAGGALAFAVAQPPDANEYTQFYVGTETGDGSVTTSTYPDSLAATESTPLVVGVTNYEDAPQDYDVVVQLQDLDDDEVVESETLELFEPSLEAGESWEREHALESSMSGEDLRLQYLLYRDEPPERPSADSAYRELHVWLDAAES